MIVVAFLKSIRSKYREWQRKRKLNAVASWLAWCSMFVIRIAARLLPMGPAARTVVVEETGALGDMVIRVVTYQWLMQIPVVPAGEKLLIVRFSPIATPRSRRKLLLFGVLRNNLVLLRAKLRSERVDAEHEFFANAGFDAVHFDRDLFRFSFIYRLLVVFALRRMGVRRHIIFSSWLPLLQEGLCMTVSPLETLLLGTDSLPSPLLPQSAYSKKFTGANRQTLWARRWLVRLARKFTETPAFSLDDSAMSRWTTSAMPGHESYPASKHFLSQAYEAASAWHQLPPPTQLRLSVDTRVRYFVGVGDYGVFSPGAPRSRSLSPEGWAALIAAVFYSGEATRLVLCTSFVRMPVLSEIFSLLPPEVQSGIFVQSPFSNFLVFGQLLRDAAYVICEDTGTFHLSCAVGTKTILLCVADSQPSYFPYPDVLVSPDRQHMIGMTPDQLRTHDAAFMAAEIIPAVCAAIDVQYPHMIE